MHKPQGNPSPVRQAGVVIVGGGFAGIEVAKAIGKAGIDAVLVDRRNHHLFQPLLYQVATAALSPADIAEPIRRVLRRYRTVEVRMGEVTGVDTARRIVRIRGQGDIAYEHLVIATGATHSYFGNDEWGALAPGLKTIDDAQAIRARLLLGFERAEVETDPDEQRRLMTIAVIGGGPTGVELAGAAAELARYALARDFRRIRPAAARVVLVEAGPRLLSAFSEESSEYARRALQRLGVHVMLGAPVEHVAADRVVVAGKEIPAGATLWAAGITAASPVGRWLGVETDRQGRIEVAPDGAVPGLPGVHLIGDAALMADADGQPLPGLAQVAKQQGQHVGRALAARIRHGRPPPPFRFRNRGNAAIIGRNAAVVEFESGRRLTGRLAWLIWVLVHIWLLVGLENRVRVTLQWLWRYVTYERGARLITDLDAESAPDTPASRPHPRAAMTEPEREPDTGRHDGSRGAG